MKTTFAVLVFFALFSCKADLALQNSRTFNIDRESAKNLVASADQNTAFYGIITAQNLEIHSGPGVETEIIGYLYAGDVVSVSRQADAGTQFFYSDNFRGKAGWILDQFVEKVTVPAARETGVTNALIVDHASLDDYSFYPYDDILNPLDLFPAGVNGDWVVYKPEPLIKKHFFCIHISNLPPVYTMILSDGRQSIKVRCEKQAVLIEDYLQYHEREYNDAKDVIDKIGPVYEAWLDNGVLFPQGNVGLEIVDTQGNRIYTGTLDFAPLAFAQKRIGGRNFLLQYRKDKNDSIELAVYKESSGTEDPGALVYQPALAFSIPLENDYWEGILTIGDEWGTGNYIIGKIEDNGGLTVLDHFEL